VKNKNIFILLKFIAFMMTFLIPIKSFSGNKDIIIVESYSKAYKWDFDYAKELSKILGKKYHLIFFEMDTKRLPKSEHEKMGLKAWDLIVKTKPILVMLGSDAALNYLGQKVEDHKIRTVYFSISNNPRVYFNKDPKYLTGILQRPLMRRSSLLIRDIIPNPKKILILFDTDRTSSIVHKEFFDNKSSVVFSGITYDIRLISTFSDWQKKILDAPREYEAIVVGLCSTLTDSNMKNVDTETVIHWSAENSKLPLFAYYDFAVGKNKAMGGLVITAASQGKSGAEMAEKLLKNPNVLPYSFFPIFLQEGKFIFSKHELNRKKITLPPNIKNQAILVD
jgi:ABC-type uncharacterized transport system substrate-binding protein